MANQTPLAAWLYSKRDQLNPRFKEFNWPAQVFPGVFDFETRFSWNSFEVEGRGVDTQREIALEKSVAEAIERLVCKALDMRSIGLAIAGTHDPAEHAKLESLERFYLNRHLENSIPFAKAGGGSEGSYGSRVIAPLSSVDFYRMITPENLFGLVCRIQSGDSTAFGFALSESFDQSARRSFLEALPNFAWMLSGGTSDQQELPWHMRPDFVERMNRLLADAGDFKPDDMPRPELQKVDVSLSGISVLEGAPLRVACYQTGEVR